MKRMIKLLGILALVAMFTASAYAGPESRFSEIDLMEAGYIFIPDITAPSGNPVTDKNWIYAVAGVLYFEDDAGTATNLLSSAATATDFDLTADADAGDFDIKSIDELEFYDTGLVIDGGTDGVLAISSDGTLALNSADWDISTTGVITNASMSADQISAAALTLGNNYLSIGTDPADAGTIRLPNAGSILFEADVTGTDVNALAVDSAEAVLIGSSGASGVTITPNVTMSGNMSAVDGTFSGNVSVTGTFLQDAIAAYGPGNTTLTIDGIGTGGVSIGTVAGTGTITLGGISTLVSLPSTVDLVLAGGDFTVTDTANADLVQLTNNTMTTADIIQISATGTRTAGTVLKITDGTTTADVIDIYADTQTSGNGIFYSNDSTAFTGSGLYMDITDNANFTGYYLRMYDGAADDFSVKRYGATIIGGLANTNMFTVTTGHIQVDDGMIEVDTDEDHSSNVTRAFAGAGTGPAFAVVDSNASTTNSALSATSGGTAGIGATITTTGTGAGKSLVLLHSGDGEFIDIDAGAARTGDVINIDMANQLAEKAIDIGTADAWTGTAGEGLIDLHSIGNIAATASMLRIDTDTGTPAGTGFAIDIDDDSLDGGEFYAVLINSNANEGLHVASGLSKFAELVTFTAGVDSDGDVDIDLTAETNRVTIETTQQDFATGSGLLQIHGDHAGNTTGDMSLLRLVYQGDGVANDSFIEAVDASTGADANGDTVFKVDSGGVITTEGTLTVNGATISGDGVTALVGINPSAEVVVDANILTAAECSKIMFLNDAETEFETTLPTLSTCPIGCTFEFYVMAAPTGADYTIVTGNSLEDLLWGGVLVNEHDTTVDGPYETSFDTITIADGVADIGDYLKIINTGAAWLLSGQVNNTIGVVLSQAD